MHTRLSTTVVPTTSKLHFRLDFEDFRFDGSEMTEIDVTGQTREIRLHCEDLEIKTLALLRDDSSITVSHTCRNGELHILADKPLSPGSYTFRCEFSGVLGDDLSGLYRSRYVDADGREAWLVTSQFEAPYARKAFPCFDEPGFKAAFALSMDIPSDMIGISNMPAESETVEGGRKTITFARTPLMSTYLLYLGAGHFDYIETRRGARTVRVYGVNEQSSRGRFACDVAADTLAFFEEYSGVPYPLPKLDLLAIPDFAAGAMENWGAVTFREVLLYADKETTSLAVRKRIAEVVAHELWHQWSGNLVTMEWWDDLWLNEAFATYIAFKAVDHFFPQWHIWEDFIEADTARAFAMDMLHSTHPIAVPVHTPNEVEEIFDSISYGKGASVLRMIESFIGEEAFRSGVGAYLTAHAYGNTKAEDLWQALERHSSEPLREMLVAWITKPGFPLIKVEAAGKRVRISQERFAAAPNRCDGDTWPIPLTWSDENGKHAALFDRDHRELVVDSGVVRLNAGHAGFYRVLYSAELYGPLGEAVKAGGLDRMERWGLVSDLWACVFAGHGSLADLVGVLEAFEGEKAVFVLRAIESICAEISRYLRLPDNGQGLFRRFETPFARAYERLGLRAAREESIQDRELRPLALTFRIRAGDEKTIRETRAVAEAYLKGSSVDPDIRKACLAAMTENGGRGEFDALRRAYESASVIEEKLAFLSALGGFDDKELLREYLDYSLGEAVRRQDLRSVFARAAANPAAPSVFGNWARDNWDRLYPLRHSHFVYMGLIQTFISSAPDREALAEAKKFLETHSEGFEKTRTNALEKAGLVLAFREREKDSPG